MLPKAMWPFHKKKRLGQPTTATVGSSELEYEHYRVLRREDGQPWLLGYGAMGLTYKAEDVNLRAPVALKVISPLIAEQPGARELFLAEARGAASLRHRNAAAIHHLGVSRAGEVFFAMEFIAGETVEVLIQRQRRLNVALALDIAQQTACALAAASQRGLIHRDLKPGNLMLSNEGDGTLVVKVIDFGLCKTLRPGRADEWSEKSDAARGPDNHFFGTPHYASPEQIRSDPALDYRSDFYSLGATLWKMLAGQPVFSGSLASIRQRHLEEIPRFEDLPSEVSPPVRALLASLLHKEPDQRPPTPLELIDRIESAAYEHRGAEADPRRHWKTQSCVPLLGSVLAHNYHLESLVDDDQESEVSPVFRAEDVAGQRLVAVRLLDRDKPLDALRIAMERLAAAPHPNLIQNHAFSSCRGQPFIVNEWMNGFSLAEVLRARGGALTAGEAQSLILQATLALEHAHAHRVEPLDMQTTAIQVHFNRQVPDAQSRRALPAQPVESWPDFSLKFGLRTQYGAVSQNAEETASAVDDVRSLGHLAAEMLGSHGATIAFSRMADGNPAVLPGAPQAVRHLISRAISPDPGFHSASEFARALTLAFKKGED